MKIRNQTVMILGVTFIILFTLLFLATEQIVETSFSRLEENEVSTNVGRASNALDAKIQTLSSMTYDYGAWDDTFYFVQGENEGYINETLYPSVLTNLGTNMILFYDSSSKLYYATGVDLESGEEKNISSSVLDHVSTNAILFSHPEKPIAGIINSPEGLLLIASNPITKSSEEGPIVGTIIFARYLDTALIEELEEQTHLSLDIQNFNEKSAALDPDKLSSILNENDNLYINPQNETSIIGTTVLNDVNGNPVLILDVEMGREIYQQGKSAINYVFAVILIIGIVCGILLTILLDRSVLDRLSSLNSNLTQITQNGSLSSRVDMKGKDELNDLADNINHMLEALEKNEIEFQQVESENKQRMETVLSSIICGTLLIDAETHIIADANPTAVELIGLPKEKIVGKVYHDIVCPAHNGECLPPHLGLTVNKSESVLINAGRKEIPILRSIVPVSLSDRTYLVESFVDMSRIKETEKALMESEEKFKKISNSAQDAIVVIDNKGEINFWNHAAEKMFDYAREEVMGKAMHELIAPLKYKDGYKIAPLKYKDGYKKGLAEFAAEGKGPAVGQILSLDARKKNGTEFPVEISLSSFKLKDGTWNAAGIIRDLTDRKKTEDALVEAKIHAETANRTKSEFLATMSHELRTPLNSIIGFSDLMLDGNVGEIADMQKKFLGNISTSGKHLLSLINNVLDLSKIEAGKMELQYELFGVYATIDEIKQLVSPLVDQNGLKLEFLKDQSLEQIYADRIRFKQILFNLTSNAIKFTPKGGKVTISATRVQNKAQFSVKDTGIGISEENISKLFQPFIQLDSAATRRYDGTGLGLSLVEKFVEMHNGKIWVESELGNGTTFTFELPLEPASKGENTTKMVAISANVTTESAVDVPGSRNSVPQIIEPSDSKGDEPLIIVVEDDDPSRELLEFTLVHEGYRVAPVKNGKEGLELAKKMKPFAIILDIMMPGMDGWDVLKHLKEKEQTQNIPVIITSMLEERELSVVWGAADYLIKPIQKGPLLATLKKNKEKMAKSSLSVFVVDDEINAVELITAMLAGEGVDVLTSYGGKEAIEIALEKQPDVIILDLMMPDISGFDVIQALKANPKTIDIPIIICTAKDLDPTDMNSLNENVSSILHKGMFTKEKLIQLMKAIQKKKDAQK